MNSDFRIYNNYKKFSDLSSQSINKISSGNKLTTAKEDPVKFYKATVFENELKVSDSVNKNMQDAISVIQVQDSSLSQVNEMTSRIRELVLQAGTEITTLDEKEVIQKEIDILKESINSIIDNTEFNGKSVLRDTNVIGMAGKALIQVGSSVEDTIEIPLINLEAKFLGDKNGITLEDVNVVSGKNINDMLNSIDSAIGEISHIRTTLGAISNNLESSLVSLEDKNLIIEEKRSKLQDVDMALELTEYSKNDVVKNAAISVIYQSNYLTKQVLNILQSF